VRAQRSGAPSGASSQAWGLFGEVYGGRVRAWTVGGLRRTLVALIACSCSRLPAHAALATLPLPQFARDKRGRASRVRTTYAPTSSYAAHVSYGWGAIRYAAASDLARGLVRLALHERGRAALALNLFTHGLLTLLVWSLIWAAQ
jgi:hypothetical protein